MTTKAITRSLATGMLLCSSAFGTILNSGDPNIVVSTGTVTQVQPVPCSEQVYCWGQVNAPWISNQDSGWNGTQLDEPVGNFYFFENFSVASDSLGTLTIGADDRADAYLVDDRTLTSTYLGRASFFFPQTFNFAVTPGAKSLLVILSNDYPAGPGNYTAAAWDGHVDETSPVPEPATAGMIASALLAAGLWIRRIS